MRTADVFLHGTHVAVLEEREFGTLYELQYDSDYAGPPISVTMPVRTEPYSFDRFPPFFDGLLLEGVMLESFLRHKKIDHQDLFGQLLAVGKDTVGAVTVEERK